jgi:hypothetical protein
MPIGDTSDVIEGKPIQGNVVSGMSPELVGAGCPGENIAVRQHDAFGQATGAARGQAEESRVVSRTLPVIVIRRAIAQFVENGNAQAPRRQRIGKRRKRVPQSARGNRRGVIEYAAELNQLIE